MGNILLSRILKYLNGTLIYDYYYQFCIFFIKYYHSIKDYSLDDFSRLSKLEPNQILSFIARLGFNDYDSFNHQLLSDDLMRLDQIKGRMLFVDKDKILNTFDSDYQKEILDMVNKICLGINKAKRVILIGALYPMSIAVELQTDLIMFGKNVVPYHAYDPNHGASEGDYFIYVSGSGRSVASFVGDKNNPDLSMSNGVVITQNKIVVDRYNIGLESMKISHKLDEFAFNYQLLAFFDLIRVAYYQNYYLQGL